MAKCPKCGCKVDEECLKCPDCGLLFEGDNALAGTLNVEDHLPLPESDAQEGQGTLDIDSHFELELVDEAPASSAPPTSSIGSSDFDSIENSDTARTVDFQDSQSLPPDLRKVVEPKENSQPTAVEADQIPGSGTLNVDSDFELGAVDSQPMEATEMEATEAIEAEAIEVEAIEAIERQDDDLLMIELEPVDIEPIEVAKAETVESNLAGKSTGSHSEGTLDIESLDLEEIEAELVASESGTDEIKSGTLDIDSIDLDAFEGQRVASEEAMDFTLDALDEARTEGTLDIESVDLAEIEPEVVASDNDMDLNAVQEIQAEGTLDIDSHFDAAPVPELPPVAEQPKAIEPEALELQSVEPELTELPKLPTAEITPTQEIAAQLPGLSDTVDYTEGQTHAQSYALADGIQELTEKLESDVDLDATVNSLSSKTVKEFVDEVRVDAPPAQPAPTTLASNLEAVASDSGIVLGESEVSAESDSGTLDIDLVADPDGVLSKPKPAEDGSGDSGTLDIDLGPSLAATIDSISSSTPFNDPNLTPAALPLSNSANDQRGTVILPGGNESAKVRKTVQYGEQELKEAQEGKSTAGRLNSMWRKAAQTSQDVGKTMFADVAMASDSVFKRVANRKISSASSPDVEADYQIIDKLGQGSMGIVYSARQTAVDRVVAIKMIKSTDKANSESQKKFLYEAQITADLDHPNIVPIHELGCTDDGALFYAMKKVTGTEWKEVIGQKSKEENVEIFMKVADAMAFAHSKGVIHRDLKPENTMLGDYGAVYVTDWGLAINLRNKKFSLGGTPIYMAPEMAGHKVDKIGTASDIYVLGGILFQVITGRGPHTGKSVTQCLRAALHNEIVPIETDDALMPIAMKALATEPEDRYRSVEEMQDAIREYRRHAESISIADRSRGQLEEAIVSKDYEKFSRSVFGYQEALDLWPENKAALTGLPRARQAYAQCALDQGNYELAMQTVDRNVAEESALYNQAIGAKRESEARAKRLKNARKVLASVVLVGLLATSGLALLAFVQWGRATMALTTAEEKRKEAENAQKEEARQREIADQKTEEANAAAIAAEKARTDAEKAKIDEEKAKETALAAQKDAVMQRDAAIAARNAEQAAKIEEKRQRDLADKAKDLAVKSEQVAVRRAAQVQLGEYESKLALAQSQVAKFDVANALDSLVTLRDLKSNVFQVQNVDHTPNFLNWGYQRVNLLTNQDLPHVDLKSSVTAFSAASGASVAAAATANGKVVLLELQGNELKVKQELTESFNAVSSIAIAPKGDEIAFSFARGDDRGMMVWKPSEKNATKVKSLGNRDIQQVVYSPDGTKVIAGINNGVWVWNRQGWAEATQPTKRVEDIRGQLRFLQPFSDNLALVGAQLPGQPILVGLLNANDGKISIAKAAGGTATNPLALPEGFEPTSLTTAAHSTSDKGVILGFADGRLLSTTMETSGQVGSFTALSRQHQTSIQAIAMTKDRMLTIGEEPFVGVWNSSARGWRYDSALTGTKQNVQAVGFLNQQQILGADEAGYAIAWDVVREKQRERMVRLNPEGEVAEYTSPVIGVFGTPSQHVIMVNQDGVVDRWSLRTGVTEPIGDSRWSYFGHTPGAELVNTAVDAEAGIVVTAAKLPDSAKQYVSTVESDKTTWEFCLWDQKTGIMKDRWTSLNRPVPAESYVSTTPGAKNQTERETIEQRVSLVNRGKHLLLASDNETVFLNVGDRRELVRKSDFGSYFAVSNPRNPAWVIVIKRTAAARMINLDNPSSWDNRSLRDFSMADPSDLPLKGVWSDEGDRFYLTFASGGLAVYGWNGSELNFLWSNRKLVNEQSGLAKALRIEGAKLANESDVDLAVKRIGGQDRVYLMRRVGATSSQWVTLDFAGNTPSVKQQGTTKNKLWLETAGLEPKYVDRVHDTLKVSAAKVRSRVKVGNQMLIAANASDIYGLKDGSARVVSFSRPTFKMATSNEDATLIVVLHDNGLHKLSFDQDKPVWQPLNVPSEQVLDVDKIELSPDGRRLMLANGKSGVVRIVNVENGATIRDLGQVAAAWKPKEPATLATCNPQGQIALYKGDQPAEKVASTAKLEGQRLVGIHFFKETWKDSAAQTIDHILVHSENATEGRVEFVPVNPIGGMEKLNEGETTIAKGSIVAVSPTEGIFLNGEPTGVVTVRFASPSWDKPRRLFNLEGHLGANIECIRFANNGKAIITADSANKLFAWLSSAE